MGYRHEWKHQINTEDLLVLRERLATFMRRDSNAQNGLYEVRSLYFDNLYDKALREKINGVNRREKFRLRYYNGSTALIRLEKKSRLGELSKKEQTVLSAKEARSLLEGEMEWMLSSGRGLLQELYSKMRYEGLRPKSIVEYTREPYVFAPGNVRVTLDTNIRSSLDCHAFLDRDCPTVPVGGAFGLLEVKWDAYLPDIVRDAVQIPGRQTVSFSKYAASRIYG